MRVDKVEFQGAMRSGGGHLVSIGKVMDIVTNSATLSRLGGTVSTCKRASARKRNWLDCSDDFYDHDESYIEDIASSLILEEFQAFRTAFLSFDVFQILFVPGDQDMVNGWSGGIIFERPILKEKSPRAPRASAPPGKIILPNMKILVPHHIGFVKRFIEMVNDTIIMESTLMVCDDARVFVLEG